ncbi:polarity-defective 6 [Histoplasma capsulatum G186AR]|uniref:non-specific serine/threonine protein kinase n=2 Tax=Ajellomyces capsulatus TaxID=5037 RepID=C0NBP5_AJECG|nr:polarity-defective 6 [Histoplasma capsulatum G186AR]EEH11086.1 polarity-defective 6 [Histoplasma capsulatum G186AR]
MAPPDSRERRNACYGVNLERFEDPQHQFGLREGLPRSSSYSSSSWEDDSVPDTENFEGGEPERGIEASNDPQQSSAPDFSDEQIDSVLGLWERRSKSRAEKDVSSAVEAFPALDPEPDRPGLYGGNLSHDTCPSFGTVPTSSFSSGAPKTPEWPPSPSDTFHVFDYSARSPVSRTNFPDSSVSFPPRARAPSHQTVYGCPQLTSQSFEDQHNPSPNCPLVSPPPFSPAYEKFPTTPNYPDGSARVQTVETVDTAGSSDSIEQFSIPYSKLPLQSISIKKKPSRTLRLAASLKRILTPRHKTASNDKPTSRPLPNQASEFSAAEAEWFDKIIQQLQQETAEHDRYCAAMDSRHLDPSSAMVALTKQKAEAMRLAREQGAAVMEMCRRAKTEMPPYQFEELIGKGAYGRVYKGRQLPSQKSVAIKVLEIDSLDYKTVQDFRDESIKDFIRETKIMQQAKDAGAKNVNMIIEAFSIHSQLWLICEHCPGGSVKTLMRATGDRLEERFIIPIARELAEGLRAIHDAGIIHRDVKAANVLIHEEGRLQICDFGVAGVIQSKVDKRSTWIGTPHWMPPEMFPNRPGNGTHKYGSEIDVWAYGCTLFECATGNPPNATLRERMQIGRQLNRFPPKLDGDRFSDDLRSLVAFSLDPDPKIRPTMQNILQHPYIADSTESHPTASLSELVKIYYQWVQRGGQRVSLFNPGGAAAAEFPETQDPLDREDWNFSTTDGFERRFSLIDLDQLSASLADLENDKIPTLPEQSGDYFDDSKGPDLSAEDKANFDERVKRGAAAMEGLFNEEKPGYKYETKNDFVPVQQEQRFSSDLPLRTDTDRSSVTSTFIDINLGVFDSAHYAAGSASNHPPFQLADADTIRANRSSSRLMRTSTTSSDSGEFQPQHGPRPPTMEWTFPATMQTGTDNASHDEPGPDVEQPYEDRRDTREWIFPVMTAEEEPRHEEPDTWADGSASSRRIEPDDEMTKRLHPLQLPEFTQQPSGDGYLDSRPSTATSTQSTMSDADNDPFRFDRPVTPPGEDAIDYDDELRNSFYTTSSLDRFPAITDSVVYTDFDEGTHRSIYSYTEMPGPYQETSMVAGPGSRHGRAEGGADANGAAHGNGNTAASSAAAAAAAAAATDGDNDNDNDVMNDGDGTETTSAVQSEMMPLDFPIPVPPSMESMMEGASDEIVVQELDRLLADFLHGLGVTGEALVRTEVGRGRQGGGAGSSGGESSRGNRAEREPGSELDD